MASITATYSPEDNKLRLYASTRLDAETFAAVKAAGFKWAPRQELFVAPAWSPAREDLCLELAGEIEAEQSTLAERAAAKADRLETLSDKNRRNASAFAAAANRLSERFAHGQPILVGHHSERRARKDRDRADSAMRNAIKAEEAAGYWLYRASAAQHHANRKNAPGVRARRIKGLLAELRDFHRTLNHANLALDFWTKYSTDDVIALAVRRGGIKSGPLMPYSIESKVGREMTLQQAREYAIAHFEAVASNATIARWIGHTLNRLSFERELLGDVGRFEGKVTPVMLQEFAREHGADTPAGSALPTGELMLSSPAPLPSHIADGCTLTLTADGWRDLMQACGYEATAKAAKKATSKAATCPLLNVAPAPGLALQSASRYHRGQVDSFPVVGMSKAEYTKHRDEMRGTRVSLCGQFRFRVGPNPVGTGPSYARGWVAVFITDSKAHKMPVQPEAQAA